uniref:Phage protein n=2 Tax=unclassified bacterial viruses TaxID=12333 RepID=A0AAU8KY71_9VIRU
MKYTEDFQKLVGEKFNLILDDLKKSVADAMLYGSTFNTITYDANLGEIKFSEIDKKSVVITYKDKWK